MKKSMVSNYIYNVIYQSISLLVPLLTTPYVARKLYVADIGIYSYSTSIINYFIVIAMLGTPMYGQRRLAENPNSEEHRSQIFFEIQLFKLLSFFCVGLLYLCYVTVFEKENKALFLIQIIALLSNYFDITWFFQGLEEFGKTILRNVIIKICGMIAIFSLIKNTDDFYIYVMSMNLINLLGEVSLWFYLPARIDRVKWKQINIFIDLRVKVELFVPIMATNLYSNMDITMIGVFCPQNLESGYYEQAQKIIRIGKSILIALGVVVMPRIANLYYQRRYEEIQKIVNRSIHFMFLISCPLTIGVACCSPNLVYVFLGEQYNPSIPIIIILAVIFIIYGYTDILGKAILIPLNKHNKATIATLTSALVNFVLNFILIQKYKAIGAAVASVGAYTVNMVMHSYYARKYVPIHKLFCTFLRYFLCAVVMGVVIVCINMINAKWDVCDREMTLIIQFLVGGMCYLLLLYITKDELFLEYKKRIVMRIWR